VAVFKTSGVALAGRARGRIGMENLHSVADKYPETVWANMANVTIGSVLYEELIKSPIRSKQDILERDDRIADLSHYFERASGDQLGMFSVHAKMYLGRCLGLRGKYDKAYKLFEEVSDARLPHVSKEAKMLQKEVKTRITNGAEPGS
jgi:hypothetical protein